MSAPHVKALYATLALAVFDMGHLVPGLSTPRQYLTPYKCVFKGVVRTITNTVARRVIEIPWGARV